MVFEVNQKELAQNALRSSPSFNTALVEDGLELLLNQEQIADVNARLVQGGIRVYSIKKYNQTLEDKFLEMTGSDQIAFIAVSAPGF